MVIIFEQISSSVYGILLLYGGRGGKGEEDKGREKEKKTLRCPSFNWKKKKIKKEIETQVVISVKACPQCTKYLKT